MHELAAVAVAAVAVFREVYASPRLEVPRQQVLFGSQLRCPMRKGTLHKRSLTDSPKGQNPWAAQYRQI